jgi:hypothetical protein
VMEMSSSHRGYVESSSGIVDELLSVVVIVEYAPTNAVLGNLNDFCNLSASTRLTFTRNWRMVKGSTVLRHPH